MQTIYKTLNSDVVLGKVSLDNDFDGFKIELTDTGKLWRICRFRDSELDIRIDFHFSKIEAVKEIQYHYNNYTYYETRFVCNKKSLVAHAYNTLTTGESLRYDTTGNVSLRSFYSNGIDVTKELLSMTSFDKNIGSSINYSFKDDELFNIQCRYGSAFKMYYEYKPNDLYFNDIINYCRPKN